MNGIDLGRFEFDYDTTWAAFFLDADLRVYSCYGGRDSGEPDARLHRNSLLQTMDEVLEVHAWRLEHPEATSDHLLQPNNDTGRTPESLPLLKKNHQGCVHCHQIQEYQLLQAFHDGRFNRNHLERYPLPENLGVRIDPDHGHRILHVRDQSPARTLAPGDIITRINKFPVYSEFDLRRALHYHDDDDDIEIAIKTNSDRQITKRIAKSLLSNRWRFSDLGWRKSLRSIPYDWGFRGYALTPSQRRQVGLGMEGLAIRVIAVRNRGLAQSLGLEKGDVIIQLNGQSRVREFAEFQSDVLQDAMPGQRISVMVQRGTKQQKLQGRHPDWYTPETSVP